MLNGCYLVEKQELEELVAYYNNIKQRLMLDVAIFGRGFGKSRTSTLRVIKISAIDMVIRMLRDGHIPCDKVQADNMIQKLVNEICETAREEIV